MTSRAQRGPISAWWATVDKTLLGVPVILVIAGLILSMSASPAATARLGIENPFYFTERHLVFAVLAPLVMVGISLLPIRQARLLCWIGLAGSLLVMTALPIIGEETKGSIRWMALGPIKIQPSEMLKPCFVVASAWLVAQARKTRKIGWALAAVGLFGLSLSLLVIQPDLGQTVLLAAVWGTMVFLAGLPLFFVWMLGGLAVAGSFFAYMSIDNFSSRIDRFLTGSGDNFQVDRAMQAVEAGGWVGRGPGEGLVKRGLPDSHTDFIFAVAVEEYGTILAMMLVCLFFIIVLRAFWHSARERDVFVSLAVAGLALQFGMQATINICVNLQLAPAKGMTLPFVSYGGSSMMAVAFGLGLMLAFTRKRADMYRRNNVRIGPAHSTQLAGMPA